jgi:hypothetical protein
VSVAVGSDRGGARTLDQRINVPLPSRPKSQQGNQLRIAKRASAHSLPTDTCPLPPDLTQVVDAWPSLPEPIKAAVLALVRTATGKGGKP